MKRIYGLAGAGILMLSGMPAAAGAEDMGEVTNQTGRQQVICLDAVPQADGRETGAPEEEYGDCLPDEMTVDCTQDGTAAGGPDDQELDGIETNGQAGGNRLDKTVTGTAGEPEEEDAAERHHQENLGSPDEARNPKELEAYEEPGLRDSLPAADAKRTAPQDFAAHTETDAGRSEEGKLVCSDTYDADPGKHSPEAPGESEMVSGYGGAEGTREAAGTVETVETAVAVRKDDLIGTEEAEEGNAEEEQEAIPEEHVSASADVVMKTGGEEPGKPVGGRNNMDEGLQEPSIDGVSEGIPSAPYRVTAASVGGGPEIDTDIEIETIYPDGVSDRTERSKEGHDHSKGGDWKDSLIGGLEDAEDGSPASPQRADDRRENVGHAVGRLPKTGGVAGQEDVKTAAVVLLAAGVLLRLSGRRRTKQYE